MKKLLLTLGTIASTVAPVAAVMSCGDEAAQWQIDVSTSNTPLSNGNTFHEVHATIADKSVFSSVEKRLVREVMDNLTHLIAEKIKPWQGKYNHEFKIILTATGPGVILETQSEPQVTGWQLRDDQEIFNYINALRIA